MMKTERKRKTLAAGTRKGTKARLTHSKFSMNTKDFAVKILKGEPDQPSTDENIFNMSDRRNITSRPSKLETGATAKDEPKLKHHLEQVLIKVPQDENS